MPHASCGPHLDNGYAKKDRVEASESQSAVDARFFRVQDLGFVGCCMLHVRVFLGDGKALSAKWQRSVPTALYIPRNVVRAPQIPGCKCEF